MSNARRAQAVVAIALACLSPRLLAAGGTITDGAVALEYVPTHWGGTPYAILFGTEANPAINSLAASGWWYGFNGTCAPFPTPQTESYSGAGLKATWTINLQGTVFDATETTHVIDGQGPSGTIVSTMDIRVQGPGGPPVIFSLYHYLDSSLAGTQTNDTAKVLTDQYLVFRDGSTRLRYRAGRRATHFQIGDSNALLGLLNSGTCPQLDDGPGVIGTPATNRPAAFQFVQKLFPGAAQEVGRVTMAIDTLHDHVRGDAGRAGTYSDLLFRTWSDGSTLAWQMRRTSPYATITTDTGQANVTVLARDDFDGDYVEESVARNTQTGELTFGKSLGTVVPPTDWILCSTGDFDGDRKADLLWRDPTTDQLVVWTMDGNQKTGEIVLPDAALHNSTLVGTGDFDGDGLLDLLWYGHNYLAVSYLDANLAVTGGDSIALGYLDTAWRPLAIGDYGRGTQAAFDTQDVVWQHNTTHALRVWHMDHAFGHVATTQISASLVTGTLIGPR